MVNILNLFLFFLHVMCFARGVLLLCN